jgi:hypothetical protein
MKGVIRETGIRRGKLMYITQKEVTQRAKEVAKEK